jgi:plasmid replication initiation protein
MSKIKQLDLFLSLSPSLIPNKSNKELMERCWFDLSKNKKRTFLSHQCDDKKNSYSVKVQNNEGNGLATIYDMDLLVFITSLLMERTNKGIETKSREIIFSGYEYFYFTNKSISGKADKEFQESLERLHKTRIETSIHSSHKRTGYSSFYWISEWNKVEQNGRVIGYSVVIPEWLFLGATTKKRVLTLDDEYFHIRGGLTRFLYLLCRKARDQNSVSKPWTESFRTIHKKSGMISQLKHFNRKIRQIISNQSVPNYFLQELDNEILSITRTRKSYHQKPKSKIVDIHKKKIVQEVENSSSIHPELF